VKGIIGDPSTYFFYKNVGAAPLAAISSNIPLSLYSIFQLKFAVRDDDDDDDDDDVIHSHGLSLCTLVCTFDVIVLGERASIGSSLPLLLGLS
jgi:hypothetical protein